MCCLVVEKETNICWGANFHVEHFATYMVACIYIYVTDWVYIHTCMQAESELKKHEFRVIYIIAEKELHYFLGCADWTCERDFYCEGALSVEALET